jgi:hypothetical protein
MAVVSRMSMLLKLDESLGNDLQMVGHENVVGVNLLIGPA